MTLNEYRLKCATAEHPEGGRPLRRFGTEQGAKVRAIDDGKRSLHNMATLMHA